MGDAEKNDAVMLVLVSLGVIAFLAFIGLPWVLHDITQGKPGTAVLSNDNCREGTSCKSCIDKGGEHICVDGICDAQGNCLNGETRNASKPTVPGVKGLVYA